MNAFARALAALHRDQNLSVVCVWKAGPERVPLHPVTLRGIENKSEEQAFAGGSIGAVTGRRYLDLAVADLPTRVLRGDSITIGGEAFTVEMAEVDVEGLTWRLTLAASEDDPLPETLRATFIGDSVTAAMIAEVMGADGYPNIAYRWIGYELWLMALTGGRILFDDGDNFGVSGNRSDQALARLDSAVARGSDFLFIHIGHNDITQLNSYYAGNAANLKAALLANIAIMVNAALAAGQHPVVLPIWAHSNWATAAQYTVCAEHTAELAAWCAAEGVTYIDGYLADMIDPATGYVRTDISDGVHPNSEGAFLFGRPVAAWLGDRLARTAHLMTPEGTAVRASMAALEGDGGTVSAPFTGVLADGWSTAAAATVTGGDLVLSKRVRDDGQEEQVITWDAVTGTSMSTSDQHRIEMRVQAPEVAVGERFILVCRARFTPASAGLLMPIIGIYEFNNGSAGPRTAMLQVGANWPAELIGAEVSLRSPPITMRPGSNGYMYLRIGATVLESAGVSGEMAIWAVELLRLPPLPTPEPPDPVDVEWSMDAQYGVAGAVPLEWTITADYSTETYDLAVPLEWTITADYSTETYDLVTTLVIPGSYILN